MVVGTRSWTVLLLILAIGDTVSAGQAIRLSPGPHLFIDDYLIAQQDGLVRSINHPERLLTPVVTGPEDKCFQPYMTVLHDEETGRFRIFYNVPEDAGQSHLGYMESEDGIHFIRPHRVLEDPARIQFGASVIDEGPDCPDPSKRYKYAWWNDGGLQVAGSPDGLKWKPVMPGVVLPHNHDISCVFFDPIRSRYMAMVSMYIPGDTWTGNRRIPHESISYEMVHWKEPWLIIKPDEQDEGETQFYCMGGLIARGNLLIGMLRVLRDDLPADPGGPVAGIGYTVLAWSRDGETWQRDREPFLNRNATPGTWDHAMTWADCQIIVGDETYIYYGGYARGHKVERFTERQIGLARMPRDRYVSRDAQKTRGYLRTPLVRVEASSMTLNASIGTPRSGAEKRGVAEIRVRLLDENGKPFQCFDWDDCVPVLGDSVALPVRFEKSLRSLRGRPVQIEFALREAKLFGFDLVA